MPTKIAISEHHAQAMDERKQTINLLRASIEDKIQTLVVEDGRHAGAVLKTAGMNLRNVGTYDLGYDEEGNPYLEVKTKAELKAEQESAAAGTQQSAAQPAAAPAALDVKPPVNGSPQVPTDSFVKV